MASVFHEGHRCQRDVSGATCAPVRWPHEHRDPAAGASPCPADRVRHRDVAGGLGAPDRRRRRPRTRPHRDCPPAAAAVGDQRVVGAGRDHRLRAAHRPSCGGPELRGRFRRVRLPHPSRRSRCRALAVGCLHVGCASRGARARATQPQRYPEVALLARCRERRKPALREHHRQGRGAQHPRHRAQGPRDRRCSGGLERPPGRPHSPTSPRSPMSTDVTDVTNVTDPADLDQETR